MAKTWTIEMVRDEFKKRGCRLVSTEYINTKQPLDYIATCGHTHKISLGNFLAGKGDICKACRYSKVSAIRRLSYEDVKMEFTARGCKLLTKTYKNNEQPLTYIAICGHKNTIPYTKFQAGGGTVCSKCSKSIRYEYDEVFSEFEKQGCLLLETEYQNCKIPLRFIARCGHEHIATFDAFINAGNVYYCSECQKIAHYNIDKIKKLFADYGCKVISDQYTPKQKIRYIASCGHENKIGLQHFLAGQGRVCRMCSRPRGEQHPNYNPSLTDDARIRNRDVNDYIIWRNFVFERDAYTCRICGDKLGGNLIAHHLNSYSDFPEQRFDTDNGITLCDICHKNYHFEKGYRHSTKDAFEDWAREYRGKAKSQYASHTVTRRR